MNAFNIFMEGYKTLPKCRMCGNRALGDEGKGLCYFCLIRNTARNESGTASVCFTSGLEITINERAMIVIRMMANQAQ